MKNFFVFILCIFAFSANALEKKTNFNQELFNKAQSEGKIVVVSSWIKYCSSCASQMKVLNKAKNEFNNIEYFTFEVKNKYENIDDYKIEDFELVNYNPQETIKMEMRK